MLNDLTSYDRILARRPIISANVGLGGPTRDYDFIDVNENGTVDSVLLEGNRRSYSEPALDLSYAGIKDWGPKVERSILVEDNFKFKPRQLQLSVDRGRDPEVISERKLSLLAKHLAPDSLNPKWAFDLEHDQFLVYEER